MSLYGPSIPSDPETLGDHSIAQTWMAGYSATGALETVEVGWNVDGSLYPGDDSTPHLFIFSTVDSYSTTGCYNDWDWTVGQYVDDAGNVVNGTCVPWVQVSRRYTPGMALPASLPQEIKPRDRSTLPKDLSLSTVKIGKNWWILMQVSGEPLELLGYYAGVDASMSSYQIGGEVFDWNGKFVDDGVAMGSGLLPAQGQGFAAYHRNYFALVSGADGGSPLVHDAYICSTAMADYGYSATPPPVVQSGGPWVNYFYYGGNPTSAPTAPASGQ
jgi:hypothetical protein